MTCISAGEVFYMSNRNEGLAKADRAWDAIGQFPIQIFNVDMEFTLAAAKLKARYTMSFADAFAAALTIKTKATLLTRDKEFDALNNEPGFEAEFL